MSAQHLHGQRRQPGLGVPHGGGRVVARRAEVALPVDQRVAHRPRLGQPDEGVVDRGVAVRVVVTHHLTDDAGALDVAAVGPEALVVHRVQHAAVHRLEAVADLGQRAADDDRHRVVDVAALHLLLEVDRLDAVAAAGSRSRFRSPQVGAQLVDEARRSEALVGPWHGASHVEEADVLGVAGDEAAAGLDVLAHEDAEQLVGGRGVLEGDLAAGSGSRGPSWSPTAPWRSSRRGP